MKWRDTWGLSEFCNWSILRKDSTKDKLDKKIEAFRLKETIDGRFTITPENESEHWSLVGQYPVETSTSIPDGEYKLYHETWPYKEEKTPFVHPSTGKFLEYGVAYEPVDENFSDSQMVKYYADSLVTTANGHFDVKTVMTAFDQIVRKSKDYSHIYIEGLYPDEYGEIEIISGS